MFNSKYSKVLTVLLIVAIVGIVGTVGYFVYDIYAVKSKNNKAQEIMDQFDEKSVKREFDTVDQEDVDMENIIGSVNSVESNNQATESEKTYMEGYEVLGTIEIPKTGIKYPILEGPAGKKNLEIAVVHAYGVGLNQPGNATIFGHNYRNGLFFSDNKKLSNGDVIKITDQTGTTVTYEIYKIYETTPSDASYMQRDTAGAKEISLQTCTDDSSARLIIWAKEK